MYSNYQLIHNWDVLYSNSKFMYSETRHGAGYPTVLTSSPVVTLDRSDTSPSLSTLTAQVLSLDNADSDRVKILVRMPACQDPLGGSFRYAHAYYGMLLLENFCGIVSVVDLACKVLKVIL